MIKIAVGPMASRKTEWLIRTIENIEISNRSLSPLRKHRYVAFKPSVDVRYGPSKIATHKVFNPAPIEIDALTLQVGRETLGELKKILQNHFKEEFILSRITIFAFDEVQFFSNKIIRLVKQLDRLGKTILLTGLNLTYAEEPFGPVPALMALADEIIVLKAVCTICGRFEATRTMRLIEGKPAPLKGEKIIVGDVGNGGKVTYQPVCKECYYRFYS